jgi:hypothetical protein
MQYEMLTTIRLSFIMISLHDVRAIQPQNCICYNPNVLINNSTVACNTTHCSWGNNPNCNGNDDDGIRSLRVFYYNNLFGDYLGCNCPGFNFNNVTNYNGVDYGAAYAYTHCNDFTDVDAAYCCSYCCGLSPVYTTTTSIPSASNSIYSFHIYVLFSLAFMVMKNTVLKFSYFVQHLGCS